MEACERAVVVKLCVQPLHEVIPLCVHAIYMSSINAAATLDDYVRGVKYVVTGSLSRLASAT